MEKQDIKSPFCSAEGHSLIFIDGESEGVGKEFEGKIVSFESGIDRDRIVVDLTKAYPSESIKNITRTLYFVKNRIDGQLILEDSISLNKNSEIGSRIQINGEIERAGEKNFIVKGKYGNLYVEIKEPLKCRVEIGELSNLEFPDGTVKMLSF